MYRVLVGKPEGKRPLGRPRRRWVDNIRMDLQEVGCGPKRDEVKRGWRKLHIEEFNDVLLTQYCSGDKIEESVAGHVGRMGERSGVYRVLVGKPEGKRPLARPRRKWDDNIKMDLQEVGCGGMNWMELAQGRKRWRALMNAVMNLRGIS